MDPTLFIPRLFDSTQIEIVKNCLKEGQIFACKICLEKGQIFAEVNLPRDPTGIVPRLFDSQCQKLP